ncbi:MAG: cytochrome c-type biogenesis protein CcmH [Proteobacteria bacterium]|nr:cytochrome c-type biogenesis protein CcmH [Pseudomonadota bacterium]
MIPRLLARIVLVTLANAPLVAAAGDQVGEHRDFDLEREDRGTASLYPPTTPSATRVMDGLLCQCPGCQAKRITIRDCACGYAARQREEVLGVLAGFDLSTSSGRTAAEEAVFADQVRRYDRGVLARPPSVAVWLLPIVACVGGLGGLLASRRRRRRTAPGDPPPSPEDARLADLLDDELAATD